MQEFEKVYAEYFNDVYRFVLRLCGDGDLAEELTSETFFKALKSIDKFRGDCSLYAWLCQIAKNCYYSERKKRRRAVPLNGDAGAADPSPGPEERITDAAEARRIREALHGLPEPYKEVFMWRVFAEMNFGDIGSLFGKSANWACVTYHRARRMITEKMEKMEENV